jgi:hypothetical protein
MPFEIRKDGSDSSKPYCVYTKGKSDPHGCHATEAEAKRQQAALYVHVPEARKDEYLIAFGTAVKALGNGRVGGYLVTYGDPSTKDADDEFFDGETDFDIDAYPAPTRCYYAHGLDPTLGKKKLPRGEMKRDEAGIWAETQLDLSDRYQAAIYGLAKKERLGWSSGTAAHLVVREPAEGATRIKYWPLGLDASLVVNPADCRNVVMALKSWEAEGSLAAAPLEELAAAAAPAAAAASEGLPPSLAEDLDRVGDQVERVTLRCAGIKAGRSQFSRSRWERIARLRDELTELLSETEPRDGAAAEGSAPPPGPGEGDATEKPANPLPASLLPDFDDVYRLLAEAPLPA